MTAFFKELTAFPSTARAGDEPSAPPYLTAARPAKAKYRRPATLLAAPDAIVYAG